MRDCDSFSPRSRGTRPCVSLGSLPADAESARLQQESTQPVSGLFVTAEQVLQIQSLFGTPVYLYDMRTLQEKARIVQRMPAAYGLTVRFAMKSCPSAAILNLFHRLGLHIDASSSYEVERALLAGIPPSHIQLTAQETPCNLADLVAAGVRFNACSLRQLAFFGEQCEGRDVSIRINPGLGSGHNHRTNVGGPASSFGIWHEQLDKVKELQSRYNLRISGLHSHIGSGADPEIWQRCAALTLRVARQLPDVSTVNLGGGFAVARMPGERSTDLHAVGVALKKEFERFEAMDKARRRLRLEIEPGSYLVAEAGIIISTIIDVKDTGRMGYRYIVLDSGMTDLLRPGLYGAQHPLWIIAQSGEEREERPYVVVGHCCESGDTLTPAPGDPEALSPRLLPAPHIGDALAIGLTGAYGAAMAALNYNSFPRSPELLLAPDGRVHVIRRRQTLAEIVTGERIPELDV